MSHVSTTVRIVPGVDKYSRLLVTGKLFIAIFKWPNELASFDFWERFISSFSCGFMVKWTGSVHSVVASVCDPWSGHPRPAYLTLTAILNQRTHGSHTMSAELWCLHVDVIFHDITGSCTCASKKERPTGAIDWPPTCALSSCVLQILQTTI